MKPKFLPSWNEAQTVMRLELKFNKPVVIVPLKANGEKVLEGDEIAHLFVDDIQIRSLVSPTQGYMQWLTNQINATETYQQIGLISVKPEDPDSTSSSSVKQEGLIKLRAPNLVHSYCQSFHLKKWKYQVGDEILPGEVGLYRDENEIERKLICSKKGVVAYLAPPNQQYSHTDVLMKLSELQCRHLSIEAGKCLFCGSKVGSNAEEFCFPEWNIDNAAAMRYSKELILDIVSAKKLVMVLDLDQTILHAIKLINSFNLEEYCSKQPSPQDEYANFLEMKIDQQSKYLIKLRPFFEEFFLTCIPLYQIYIYTKASKTYADFILYHISQRLDQLIPEHKPYFPPNRIFSREDTNCLNSKSLYRLFYPGVADNFMVILDDNPNMWSKFKQNLLHTKPFVYFKEMTAQKDGQGIQVDTETSVTVQNNHDFWLHSVAKVLKDIYGRFWGSVEKAQSDPNFKIQEQIVKKHKGEHRETKIPQAIEQKVAPDKEDLVGLVKSRNISVGVLYQEICRQILKGVTLYFAISQGHSEQEKKGMENAKVLAHQLGARICTEFKEGAFLETKSLYLIACGIKKIKSIQCAQQHNIPLVRYRWIEDCAQYAMLLDYSDYIETENWNFTDEQLKLKYVTA